MSDVSGVWAPGRHFRLKEFGTSADCVGMSDTNRYITRRPPLSASSRELVASSPSVNSPAKVEALRKLVAAGQYQVSPRWLATKIFRAAGVRLP
jgi:hypothetical protein